MRTASTTTASRHTPVRIVALTRRHFAANELSVCGVAFQRVLSPKFTSHQLCGFTSIFHFTTPFYSVWNPTTPELFVD
jgi:hypothetical protein